MTESLDFREWNFKGDSGESSERRKSGRESYSLLGEYLSNHGQNIGRNIDGRVHFEEVSDRDEEHVMGQWRKVILVIEREIIRLHCLCSGVFWKVKLPSNEIGYLADAVSKQVLKEWLGLP